MSQDKHDDDRFLDELRTLAGEHSVEALSRVLVPPAPALSPSRAEEPLASTPLDSLRARVLASASHVGRLWRFAEQVGAALDLPLARARELLDRLDDPSAWTQTSAGIEALWVEGGPRVAQAVCGFLRFRAGVRSPEHEHVGEETLLVLQGGLRDLVNGQLLRPGESTTNPSNSRHVIEALPNGPDLLHLAIVQGGVRIDGQHFGPQR